ncbi:hypothetical protein EPO34_01385 [Patescibacteria group bacterium]|nr:MAG: hypothetical protein EPO34_01385 [Patescibacteria group bacterium]
MKQDDAGGDRPDNRIDSYDALVEEAAKRRIRSAEGYDRAAREDPQFPAQPYYAFREEWKLHGDWPGFLKRVDAHMKLGARKSSKRIPPPRIPPHAVRAKDPAIRGRLVRVAGADIED